MIDEYCRVQPVVLWVGSLALWTALVGMPGCGSRAPDRLVVATTWPAGERKRLDSAFRSWVEASHEHLGHRRVHLEWLTLAPGDDPVKLAHRASSPDVLLGGAAGSLKLLMRMDDLSPIRGAGSATWCSVTQHGLDAESDQTRRSGRRSMGDPRVDPAALRDAMDHLSAGDWRTGYAVLVRTAATSRRFQRVAEPRLVPTNVSGAGPDRDLGGGRPADSSRSAAGVAILRAAANQELAQGFLRFLMETQGARPVASPNEGAASDDASPLVADLLGATLVDAQDELWTAWRSLEALDDHEQAVAWLTELPPWPPASVAKYLGREGERAMSLIETLATEVAPEAAGRAWLLRSWLAPGRTVDSLLFSELTQAAEGRLAREPRFRAWLREEWTAWARQRYRRVARFAAGGGRRQATERTSVLP